MRWKKSLKIWAISLILIFIPITALSAPERKVLTVEDASGIWFREDVAHRMLADLSMLNLLQEKIKLLEFQVEILKQANAAIHEHAKDMGTHLNLLQAGMDQAAKMLQVGQSRAFFDTSLSGYIIGTIATTVLAIGLHYGFR